jgi:hypothetical protein
LGGAGNKFVNVQAETVDDLYKTDTIMDRFMKEPCTSVPKNLEIIMIGIPAELEKEVQEFLGSLLDTVGQKMDLTGLDGVTFASDYHQALLDLNRGYDTDYKLTPSNGHGIGIAMSPSVIRDDKLKTHIVISAQTFLSMIADKRGNIAVNTVAHECAHVELNHLYDEAFPGTLLRTKLNVLDHFRTDCMLACWNEFGACWRSATFGPTEQLFYEAAFLAALEETRPAANAAIMEYRSHHDIGIVMHKVCDLYGNLLKYSAYHLGNLQGHGIDWRSVPTTADALQGHWFILFFERLDRACKAIAAELGNWTNSALFDALRDIAEDLVADGGMHFGRHEDDRISLDIPMTIETMPVPPHLWR